MKAFSQAFEAHLASGATTLCTCWRIERADGAVLGFSDHDRVLGFGGLDYLPAHGLEGGERAARLGEGVETAEVLGVLHHEGIGEADILLGRFDGARVETWRVDWREVETRALIRVDTIGEIVREDGIFRAELRSGQHALNRASGRIYHHLCDAQVGDGRCGVNLEDARFFASATVVAVRDGRTVEMAGLEGFGSGWFSMGTARWNGGKRAGLVDPVARQEGAVLRFAARVGDWVEAGDALTVFAGCDRRFSTCREKFQNTVNFRGFPHIPGSDFLMRYPHGDDPLDGRPLVR